MTTAATATLTPATELARQIDVLVDAGYPSLCDLTEAAFREALEPLSGALPRPSGGGGPDAVPFILVVPTVPAAAAAARMSIDDKPAVLMLGPDELDRFCPIDDVPAEPYLLIGVDTGSEFCDVRPADALPVIRDRGRVPLTIAEGVALVTVRPDMLRRNKCFSLLASRCGDKRVPAIWLERSGAPKLGWCWDGNPHTWLGAASAAGRVAGSAEPGST